MKQPLPDINNPYTIFVPNKKTSAYKSDCPYNEGYYLSGGHGGVKCSACKTMLPGHMWYSTCQKDYNTCEYFIMPETAEQIQLF